MMLSWPSAVGVTLVLLYKGAWTAKCLSWLYTTTLRTIPYVTCTCCSRYCSPNPAWSRVEFTTSLLSTILALLFYPAWKLSIPSIVLLISS
ncbi:hypothetical protein BKA83DRAFT_4358226 [Pisolithus microcarpus]|nr:hypothetical protein BKA83DRAFT_4358226 [Pisolithus microcarpus]